MRQIEFRVWDNEKKIYVPNGEVIFSFYGDTNITVTPNDQIYVGDSCHENYKPERFIVEQLTPFKDKNGKEIYEGDILSDWNEVDGKMVQSKQQVFFNEPTGSYHLDNSFNQDKTCSTELWLELNDFNYEVTGTIHD